MIISAMVHWIVKDRTSRIDTVLKIIVIIFVILIFYIGFKVTKSCYGMSGVVDKDEIKEEIKEALKEEEVKSFKISELGRAKIENTRLRQRILELENNIVVMSEFWVRHFEESDMVKYRFDSQTYTFILKK